ncbi:MAG: Crp/Fnr family transcriptional regulator [Acidiferrobacterales bacterium]
MVEQPTAETLSGVEFFRGLSRDDRQALASRCHAHRYAAKQQIVSHADESTDVYFIVSGHARVTIYSVSGKEVTFRDLGAGEMFGDLAAIDGKPRSATVVTLTDSFIVSMPADVFRDVLRDYPSVGMAALQELTGLVRILCERVVELSTLGVKNRIHAELLRLAQKNMKDNNTAVISPAPTHADIAHRVSTHREAVTRELNHLTNIGLLGRSSGILVINDVAELRRMVEEVLGDKIAVA